MKKTGILLAGLVALGLYGLGAKAETSPNPQTLGIADCGLVRGLLPAIKAFSMETWGAEDTDYWARYFESRRILANGMAKAFVQLSKEAQSPFLRSQLQGMSQSILSAPQKGSGDDPHWAELAAQQDSTLVSVARQITNLEQMCAVSKLE